MKAAALIYTSPEGEYKAIPSDSLIPLLDVAQRARVTGLIKGAVVLEGIVLANWRSGKAYQFRCKPAVIAAAQDSLKPKAKRNG